MKSTLPILLFALVILSFLYVSIFIRPSFLFPIEKNFLNEASNEAGSDRSADFLLAKITKFDWDEVCIYPAVDDSMAAGIDEYLEAWGLLTDWRKTKPTFEAPFWPFNRTYNNILFFKNSGKISHVIRTLAENNLFSEAQNNFCGTPENVEIYYPQTDASYLSFRKS